MTKLVGVLVLIIAANCIPYTAAATDCVDAYCAMQEQATKGLARFLLPKTFFPNTNHLPYYVSIWSHMAIKYPNGSATCSNKNAIIVSTDSRIFQKHEIANVTWYWTHKWARSPLLKLLGNGRLYVYMSETHFFALATLFINQVSLHGNFNPNICTAYCLEMTVDLVLGCTPFEDETRDLWEGVLQWSKAFALSLSSDSLQPEGSDIGYVFQSGNGWPNKISGFYSEVVDQSFKVLLASLITTQVLFDLAGALVLMWIFPTYVLQWSTTDPKQGKVAMLADSRSVGIRIFWSLVTIGGLILIASILIGFTYHVWHKEGSNYHLVNFITTTLLSIMQLLYATIVSKNIQHLYVPRAYLFVGSLLCFDFVTKKQRNYRAIVVISLWVLMGFFQQWVSAVVPIIILLMISFIRTISTVAIFVSLFFFLVMLVATVAHNFHRMTERSVSPLHALIEVVAILILVGCVFSSLFVFWFLILDGFSADSVSDLVWSLGLPAVLSGVAIYMKRFFLKGVESDSGLIDIVKEEEGENQENNATCLVVKDSEGATSVEEVEMIQSQ